MENSKYFIMLTLLQITIIWRPKVVSKYASKSMLAYPVLEQILNIEDLITYPFSIFLF